MVAPSLPGVLARTLIGECVRVQTRVLAAALTAAPLLPFLAGLATRCGRDVARVALATFAGVRFVATLEGESFAQGVLTSVLSRHLLFDAGDTGENARVGQRRQKDGLEVDGAVLFDLLAFVVGVAELVQAVPEVGDHRNELAGCLGLQARVLTPVVDRTVAVGHERAILPVDSRRSDERLVERALAVVADEGGGGVVGCRLVEPEQFVDISDIELPVGIARLVGEVRPSERKVVVPRVPLERLFVPRSEGAGPAHPELHEFEVALVGRRGHVLLGLGGCCRCRCLGLSGPDLVVRTGPFGYGLVDARVAHARECLCDLLVGDLPNLLFRHVRISLPIGQKLCSRQPGHPYTPLMRG